MAADEEYLRPVQETDLLVMLLNLFYYYLFSHFLLRMYELFNK